MGERLCEKGVSLNACANYQGLMLRFLSIVANLRASLPFRSSRKSVVHIDEVKASSSCSLIASLAHQIIFWIFFCCPTPAIPAVGATPCKGFGTWFARLEGRTETLCFYFECWDQGGHPNKNNCSSARPCPSPTQSPQPLSFD